MSVMTRRTPGWLVVSGSLPALVIIEDRAAIVCRIFEWAAAGLGKERVARTLNRQEGRRSARAEEWHLSYIQKILPTLYVGDAGSRPTALLRDFGQPERIMLHAVTCGGFNEGWETDNGGCRV